jgi:hypothetical protein
MAGGRATVVARGRATGEPAGRVITFVVVSGTALAAGLVIVYVLRRVDPVDFLVYRYAVPAAWHGFPLYQRNLTGPLMPEGGLPYTYTPFALLPLAVTTLFPSWTAYLMWSFGSMLMLAWVLGRFVPLQTRRRPLVLAGAVVLSAFTGIVNEHVAFGQIGIALMTLVVVDLVRPTGGLVARVAPRGVLVGIATAIKLTPGLFLLYFLLTRQWRLLLWSALGTIGATLLAWAVLPDLTSEFFAQGLGGLTSRVSLGTKFATPGNGSVEGALAGLVGWTGLAVLVVALLAAAGGLGVAVRCHRLGREVDAWLAVGITAPIVSPISWVHHWVFLLPALVSLLLRAPSRRSTLVIGAAAIVLVVGPDVGEKLVSSGHMLLTLVGVPLRECLFLIAIGSLVVLLRSSVDVTPDVLRRPAREAARSGTVAPVLVRVHESLSEQGGCQSQDDVG